MNRRLTGILAWCALGLVVAIPGTDVLMRNVDSSNIDVAQVAEFDPSDMPGPKLPSGPTIDLSADAIWPVSQPAWGETEEPAIEVADASDAPLVDTLPPIVPLGVEPADNAQTAVVPEVPEIEPVTRVAAVIDDPQSIDNEGLALDFPEESLEVAAIAPVVPFVEHVEAPVPMPASLRPVYVRTPIAVNQSVETLEFEDDGRSRVNIITSSRQPVLEFEEPVNAPFWGDDPRYDNGQRLDSYDTGEIARADDASDSQFYEIWSGQNRPAGFRRRGSFSDQLPARRGSSVRLDLLQQN